jgi:hypothetical protein
VKHAVGRAKTAPGVVDELERPQRLGMGAGGLPHADSLQECDGGVEERSAPALRGLCGSVPRGIHNGGRQAGIQAAQRCGEPGRTGADDDNIDLIWLCHERLDIFQADRPLNLAIKPAVSTAPPIC